MDLNHLTAFVAVAETGGFTAAAKKLGLPKSSVSRSIVALEEALDVRLVHRTTRHVGLSAAGTSLYERVGPQLAQLREVLGDVHEQEKQLSGELRISAPIDFGTYVLPDIVTRFLARYPAVKMKVNVTNEMVDIVREGYDLAIRIPGLKGLRDTASLSAKRLTTLAIRLFASPAYLARRGTPRTPDDLERHDFITFRTMFRTLDMTGPDGATVKVKTSSRLSCDELSFAHQAARRGAGITFLPSFIAQDDIADGRLTCVLSRYTIGEGDIFLVWPTTRKVPRLVTTFRDFILESTTP